MGSQKTRKINGRSCQEVQGEQSNNFTDLYKTTLHEGHNKYYPQRSLQKEVTSKKGENIMKKTIQKTLIIMAISLLAISIYAPQSVADPSIMILGYSIDPPVLMPGDTAILTLTISNAETTSMTTETAYYNSLPAIQIIETNGAAIDNIFITKDGDGKHFIKAVETFYDLGEVGPGASFSIDIPIIAEENISEGLYTPIVNINLKNNVYEDVSFPIPVTVNDNTIDISKTSVPKQISTIGLTDISLTIVNNRYNEINGITIHPKEQSGLYISPNSIFISSLDALSSEQIAFSIQPQNPGEKTIIFDIQYYNGENSHTTQSSIMINSTETSEVGSIIYDIPSTIEHGQIDELRLKVYNAKNNAISGVVVIPHATVPITPSEYFIGNMDTDDIFSVSFDIDTTSIQANQTYPIEFTVRFKQDGTYYEAPSTYASFTVTSKTNGNGTEAVIGGSLFFISILLIAGFIFYRRKRRKQ